MKINLSESLFFSFFLQVLSCCLSW